MQPIRKCRSCDRSGPREAGFGLIELVVAISVLAVVTMGLGLSMGSALNLARNNRNRTIAANLASQEMDIVRSAKFVDLTPGLLVSNQVLDGVSYTVRRESLLVAQNASSGPCDSAAGTQPAFLRVTVFVSWPNMTGTRPVSTQTVLTPPVGAYDPNSGNLAVTVRDRTATVASGHTVSVTGPGVNKSEVTTSEGCAFFGFLPAGTYDVKVDNPSYVDRQGVAAPTRSVDVTVGLTQSVQFDYDRAASAIFSVAGVAGGVAAPTLPVTVANAGLQPIPVKSFSGTSFPLTVSTLFPFTDGYEYFLGLCNDADPEGLNGSLAYYPGAVRPPAMATGPGQTVSTTIQAPSLDVTVTKTISGVPTPMANATVTLLHAVSPGCTVATSYVAGVTDSTGTLRVLMPFGTWKLRAPTGLPSTDQVFTPAGPNPTSVALVMT